MSKDWGKEKVRCDACDCDVTNKGMKNHVASAKHQRAIGALAPKPPKPEREPRGRPKKDGPLFKERNPDYYTTTYKWCDVCEKNIVRGQMSTHRGSSAHLAAFKAAVLAEVTCAPCAPCVEGY